MSLGVVYVAYGEPARRCVERGAEAIRRFHPNIDITVLGDCPVTGCAFRAWPERVRSGRWAKLNIDRLSPYDPTIYLDADTLARAPLTPAIDMLADGWELVIAPSRNQGTDWLWHLSEEEREHTRHDIGHMLQLQAGVWFIRKTTAIHRLFALWRAEWEKHQGPDQGALMRALQRQPVRLWLLGRDWNGGAAIAHNFGEARR